MKLKKGHLINKELFNFSLLRNQTHLVKRPERSDSEVRVQRGVTNKERVLFKNITLLKEPS